MQEALIDNHYADLLLDDGIRTMNSGLWYVKAKFFDNAGNSTCTHGKAFYYINPDDKPVPLIEFTGESLSNSPTVEMSITTNHNYNISFEDSVVKYVYPIVETDIYTTMKLKIARLVVMMKMIMILH